MQILKIKRNLEKNVNKKEEKEKEIQRKIKEIENIQKKKKNVKEIINDYDNYCDICFGKYETKKCNYG